MAQHDNLGVRCRHYPDCKGSYRKASIYVDWQGWPLRCDACGDEIQRYTGHKLIHREYFREYDKQD